MSHLINLLTAYIRVNRKFFAGGLIIGLGLVILVLNLIPIWQSRPTRQVLGMSGNYTLTTLPLPIQEKLSLGLTSIEPDDLATAGAALSWEASDSGKTYTFHLNSGLFWHDGRRLTAADVNYNLADVKISTPNKSTIIFNLQDSFAPLPSVLSQPLFRPGLVGLGSYRLESFRQNGRFLQWVVIKDNRNEIQYKFYPTVKAELTALKLGEIQRAVDVIDKRGTADYSRQAILFFNLKREPFSEKIFRQALAAAISPVDFGQKSQGPIAPISWAYNPNLRQYDFDLAAAKALLSKSSAASGSGKITLSTTEDLGGVANQIASDWRSLGLNVETDITADQFPKDFQVFLKYQDIPPDPDQYRIWHSTSPESFNSYKSPKVDKLLEEGRQIINPEVRLTKYQDFQKAITEDLPVIFLFFPKVYSLGRG